MTTHFGKFRGVVANNVDPMQIGRVQVTVPDVLDDAVAWALPCVPYAGPGVGFFALPPVGANVWVEFEGGDASRPIWVGGFWDAGEAPAEAKGPATKVIQTDTATFAIDDAGHSVRLALETPAGPVTIEQSLGGLTLSFFHNSVTLNVMGLQVHTVGSRAQLGVTGIRLEGAGGGTLTLQGPAILGNGSGAVVVAPGSVLAMPGGVVLSEEEEGGE